MDTTPAGADTIAAIATPPGAGGIGIVRVSGPLAPDIARGVLGEVPKPRHARLTRFYAGDGGVLDTGVALYFPAPHSFTGEHVLELQGHGGPVVMGLLLKRAGELGARPARPGEFSERAFLNGKLDLAQAEAVADLIAAASAEAARAAMNSLQGMFSERVRAVTESVIRLRVQIEAALDFPEEEIDFLSNGKLYSQVDVIRRQLKFLLDESHQGQLLHDGMTVVLAGRPNAGKSSLLNLLARRDSAIVSTVPGTTRDVLREQIQIDGLPLHILDTAGLRRTASPIESEGVRRAYAAMQHADRVLLLVDDSIEDQGGIRSLLQGLPDTARVSLVRNKIDMSQRPPGVMEQGEYGIPEVALSAQTGLGLDALHTHLKACMGYQTAGAGSFSARHRHLQALQRADSECEDAQHELAGGRGELAAEALRRAQQSLGEITGEFTSDELLGRIFSTFCIGK
jgi:tRNA modification GTPase